MSDIVIFNPKFQMTCEILIHRDPKFDYWHTLKVFGQSNTHITTKHEMTCNNSMWINIKKFPPNFIKQFGVIFTLFKSNIKKR